MCRPTKMTNEYISILETVLGVNEDDSINAIIYTDEDLFELINDKLPEKENICIATWKGWKAKALKNENLDENGKKFLDLIKTALKKQKKYLFEKFIDEPTHWQKWAWIIERKFSEWNIRHITEVDVTDNRQQENERRSDELLNKALKAIANKEQT